MKVFNLTNAVLVYRGKRLAPNGGFDNFPELDSFIPDRDKALAEKKRISFGSLPSWFLAKKDQEKRAKKPAPPAPVVVPTEPKTVPAKPDPKTVEPEKKSKGR